MIEFSDYTNLATVVVAAGALAVSASGAAASFRHNETVSLLDIFERYERYSQQLVTAAKGTEAEQKMALLNLLNYVENLCYIHNRRLVSPRVLLAIRTLAADFIASMMARYDFEALLAHFALGPEVFAEIRRFKKRFRRRIAKKAAAFPDSIYAPPKTEPPA